MKINYFAILLIALLSQACKGKEVPMVEEEAMVSAATNTVSLTDKQAKNLLIELCAIGSGDLLQIEKVNGKIDVPTKNKAYISCPSGGYVTHTSLAKGMKITKGQVVATVKNQQFIDLQQEYLTIKNRIHFAEIEVNRQKTLAQNNATNDKILQQTNAVLQENLIQMESIAEKLKLLGIKPDEVASTNIQNTIKLFSPISGYVQVMNVNLGKYVSPTDVLFEITNPNNSMVILNVYNTIAHTLKIGQKLSVYSNLAPDQKLLSKVIAIHNEVDENDIVEIHCQLDKSSNLPIGTYITAEIATKKSLNQSLPANSIVSFEGKSYVFASLGNNGYEMLEVKTGIEQDDEVEILNAKELLSKKIVKKGAYTLLMVMKNIAE